ncbi:MAG: MBL fold metallo-hydrolase, partial [Aquabacterium sp.]
RGAYIDSGTNASVPRLLQALAALGLDRSVVDYVIPTHVHLDHAGGAGALMQALPAAMMLVHPRGAPHMVDPSRLYQGALAVYGQAEMDRTYGQLVPTPAERVCASSDGMRVQVGNRTLELIDTPGHARHHHCIWDERSAGWFTGDTFGLSYREFDNHNGPWITPTATPVQFDPAALEASVRRMMQRQPSWIYPTHYGRAGEVQRLGNELIEQVHALVAVAQALRQAPHRHQALVDALVQQVRQHGLAHGLTDLDRLQHWLALDIELNAQGLAVWLDRPGP